MERIQTGSKNLDRLLCGGIETNAITEFYGASGSGKTQICHSLCVAVSQSRSKDGVLGKSIYIDTAGTFRPERIAGIADARGFSTSCALSNILYKNVMIIDKQEFIIENIQSIIDNCKNTRLLVIDSVIGNYRAEFLGKHMLSQRQQRLYKFMRKLSSIAQNNKIAVIVTNQVNSGRGRYYIEDNPTGGNIMANTSTYRIHLRRFDSNRVVIVARIVKSPYHPDKEAYFSLGQKGLEDNLQR